MTTSITFTARIVKDGFVHTLKLENCRSDEFVDYRTALWLLDLGFKPPRFFGIIKARELSAFPKEVLQQMRKLHDRRRHH